MRRMLAFLVLVLCAAAADAGWWDDAGASRPASLDDLRRDPGVWRDVVVSLDVRVAGVIEAGDAGVTRFVARDWRAVSVVAAAAASASRPLSSIFVRRGSEAERRLAVAAKDARVQLRGSVRDVVAGEPWIEVFEATGDADPLNPDEANVVARADDFLARGNPAAAETLYRGLAAKRSMPKAVRADICRKIAESCRAQRRLTDAVAAYAEALALDPDDGATSRQFASAREAAKAASPVASAPAAVVAATRRLMPPAGMNETPADAKPPSPPNAPASQPQQSPPTTSADTAMLDEPPPPSPPKPQIAGPK